MVNSDNAYFVFFQEEGPVRWPYSLGRGIIAIAFGGLVLEGIIDYAHILLYQGRASLIIPIFPLSREGVIEQTVLLGAWYDCHSS